MTVPGEDQTGRSPVLLGVYVPRKEVYPIQLGKNDAIKNLCMDEDAGREKLIASPLFFCTCDDNISS